MIVYISVCFSPEIEDIAENTKKIERKINKYFVVPSISRIFMFVSAKNYYEAQLWPKQKDTYHGKIRNFMENVFFVPSFTKFEAHLINFLVS